MFPGLLQRLSSGWCRPPGSGGHHRPRLEQRLANVQPREQAALLEPGFRRRRPPQRLALRIGEVPSDRLQIGIDRLIVRAIDLYAVTVGIQDVEEEGVSDDVT